MSYGFGEFKLSVCCSSKDFEAVETEALICHCHVHRTDVVSSEPAKQDNKGKVSLLFPVLCTHCSILLILHSLLSGFLFVARILSSVNLKAETCTRYLKNFLELKK